MAMMEPHSLKPHLPLGFEPKVWRRQPGMRAGWEPGTIGACQTMRSLRSIVKRMFHPYSTSTWGVSLLCCTNCDWALGWDNSLHSMKLSPQLLHHTFLYWDSPLWCDNSAPGVLRFWEGIFWYEWLFKLIFVWGNEHMELQLFHPECHLSIFFVHAVIFTCILCFLKD